MYGGGEDTNVQFIAMAESFPELKQDTSFQVE